MKVQKPKLGSFLELHMVVIILGFTAILGKMITVSALELVFFRTLFASIGLLILLVALKMPIIIKKIDAYKLLGIGFIVCLHWFLFFYAARVSNVSVSLVGLATSSLWIAILQPLFGKSTFSFIEIFLGVFMIFGLYMIFNADLSNWYGLFLSISCAFIQAVFYILNSKFTQKYHSFTITFYEMLGAFLISLLFLAYSKQRSIFTGYFPSNSDWVYLLILAGVCSVYAYSAIVRLLINISPFTVNLAINLEPVYGIIMAYFIFGETEKMTLGFYLGTFIISLGVFGYQIYSRNTVEDNSK